MEFLIHLGKASLFLILFYACYGVLFRHTTFFQLNRAYLVAALGVSLCLPLISVEVEVPVVEPAWHEEPIVVNEAAGQDLFLPAVEMETAVTSARSWPDVETILLIAYLAGVLISILMLARKLFRLWRLTRLYSDSEVEGVAVLTRPELSTIGSFSFLGRVYMSAADYNHHFEKVYRHEKIHAGQLHSLDILWLEFVRILLWFNPVLMLYKRSLQEVHEYLADSSARDRESYARFLVNYTMSAANSPHLGNSFCDSQTLKSRIVMLYKKKDSRYILFRYVPVVPVILLTVMLTASRRYSYHTPDSPISESINRVINNAPDPIAPNNTHPTPAIVPTAAPEKSTATTPATGFVVADSARKIKGTVVDMSDNSPIPGAIIVIKGGSRGAITDSDGKFDIVLSDGQDRIVVSFVGYGSQTIRIAEESNVTVSLVKQRNQLEEVVVVGYFPAQPSKPSEELRSSAVSPIASSEFLAVEQMPEFPGGTTELYKYLARKIRYPGEASRANIQGHVYISFIVNKLGNIRSPKVIKGPGYGLDEEALRVVISMPQWKPALQNGVPVDMEYTLPVNFQIETPAKSDKQGSTTPTGKPTDEGLGESSEGTKIRIIGSDKSLVGSDTPSDAYFSSPAELNHLRNAPRMGFDQGNAPLYIVDGKEYKSSSIDRINPNTISAIEVRKDLATIEQYGEKAKNGVILITTKKAGEKKQ